MDYIKVPMDIENNSFRIIEKELGEHSFNDEELLIVKRVIHTTADFDYKNLVYISKRAIEEAKAVLSKGVKIYTDTNMALSGINKRALASLNCEISCYVNDDDVRQEASRRNITRSIVGLEKAVREGCSVFVFGNAPTALFKLKELIEKEKVNPKFIIAAPVGFVGAKESKEEIEKLDIPMITIRGRKGGSNVAASIMNAILYMITTR